MSACNRSRCMHVCCFSQYIRIYILCCCEANHIIHKWEMICCLCTCRWQDHSGSNCQRHNQFYKQLHYWDWVSRRPDNGIGVSRSVPTVVCPLVHAHPLVLPSSAEGIPEPPKTIILVVPWAATVVILAFTALGVIFAFVCSVLTCALCNRRYI